MGTKAYSHSEGVKALVSRASPLWVRLRPHSLIYKLAYAGLIISYSFNKKSCFFNRTTVAQKLGSLTTWSTVLSVYVLLIPDSSLLLLPEST